MRQKIHENRRTKMGFYCYLNDIILNEKCIVKSIDLYPPKHAITTVELETAERNPAEHCMQAEAPAARYQLEQPDIYKYLLVCV